MSKQWRQTFSSTCGIYEEVTPSPALTKLRLKILTNMLRLREKDVQIAHLIEQAQ